MNDLSLKNQLKDVHAYAATPFRHTDLLELDLEGFAGNLNFMIECGVRVVNVCGGTGEHEALSVAEMETLTACAMDTAGTRALIVPTLPGNLSTAIYLARRYEDLGARVALAMAPYIRHAAPADQEGITAYYRMLSHRTGLALMPYNTQGWQEEFFHRLSEIGPVIGVKDPCTDPHPMFRAIKSLGDRFVWIGNKRHDPGVLQYRFQAGIDGFTAGFVNFIPQFELELFEAAKVSDWERMGVIQAKLAPVEVLRNEYGDGIIKAGMDLVGLAGGPVRPPRMNAGVSARQALALELRNLGISVRR